MTLGSADVGPVHEKPRQIGRAADLHLHDARFGGYRLNTAFGAGAGRLSMSLGCCFSFAFGHKENGATFSHMVVMYAHGLYRRGLVQEGIYRHSQDLSRSGNYPGIPENIEPGERALILTMTAGRKVKLSYHNADRLPWKGQYRRGILGWRRCGLRAPGRGCHSTPGHPCGARPGRGAHPGPLPGDR